MSSRPLTLQLELSIDELTPYDVCCWSICVCVAGGGVLPKFMSNIRTYQQFCFRNQATSERKIKGEFNGADSKISS